MATGYARLRSSPDAYIPLANKIARIIWALLTNGGTYWKPGVMAVGAANVRSQRSPT